MRPEPPGGRRAPHRLAQLWAEHTPGEVRRRLRLGPERSYLRDFIYGAIDGAVTTFAVVSGVAGAGLSAQIVIVLGVANLVGDGFSMAVGNFLGTRAHEQLRERARRAEQAHIATVPEGEREEIRQIFSAKGFSGEDLERVVDVITSDPRRWVDTMLQEELGFSLERQSPARAAATTFIAFVVVGSIPLLSFVGELTTPGLTRQPFVWSALLTGLAFFVVGAFKGRMVGKKWYLEGATTLVVGSLAAGLAYAVGLALSGIVSP